MSVLDTLAAPVAFVLKQIHAGLSSFLPSSSGWAWGLSIVFLTMTVRIVLFPLFVKQIKSQRTLQMMQPKMKEIREKSPVLKEMLDSGALGLVGATYDIETGKVTFYAD